MITGNGRLVALCKCLVLDEFIEYDGSESASPSNCGDCKLLFCFVGERHPRCGRAVPAEKVHPSRDLIDPDRFLRSTANFILKEQFDVESSHIWSWLYMIYFKLCRLSITPTVHGLQTGFSTHMAHAY